MESTLHRQLKAFYANGDAAVEVKVGRFRIDVVCGDELIEIQHGSLAAIRQKVHTLLARHRVRVVKPIVARKRLVKRRAKGRSVVDRRMSPKRGTILDLFDDLVYFVRVFPHQSLVLEVPLVYVEEWRYPGHGRRRRKRQRDHQIEDQKLIEVQSVHRFATLDDLLSILPKGLPRPFHTQDLAEGLGTDRWRARKIAYCLRETGAIRMTGKSGNAILYDLTTRNKKPSRRPRTATV